MSMGKMYYSEEETAAKLGVEPDQLQQYVDEGKLHAYQDGANKMYKAAEVDEMAGGGDEVDLAPAEDAVTLSDEPEEQPSARKEDTVISTEGISIFDDEDLEIEAADPMAKTQVSQSLEDQIALEGVGSGSGLLDLTRESDDTSLGAEVLEHIDMEGVPTALSQETPPPPDILTPEAEMPETAGAPVAAGAGQQVVVEQVAVTEAPDASSGAFGGLALGGAAMMILMGFVMSATFFGIQTDFLQALKKNMTIILVAGALVSILAAVLGFFLGKMAADKQRAMQRVGA
jgi:hypothetical protein